MMENRAPDGVKPTVRQASRFQCFSFASHPLSTVGSSLPSFQNRLLTRLGIGAIVLFVVGGLVLVGRDIFPFIPEDFELPLPHTISVAFLGNSMFYFNDFPRFLEELISDGHNLRQDS
jgi:hypothetical protein